MNQTLPTADLNTAGTTDIIPSVAIDRIIAQRNEGIALFMKAMECLATARRILLDASPFDAWINRKKQKRISPVLPTVKSGTA